MLVSVENIGTPGSGVIEPVWRMPRFALYQAISSLSSGALIVTWSMYRAAAPRPV